MSANPKLRTFAERFTALRAQRGPFCLGLDPGPELLAAWGMKDDIWGLRSFCNRVIDAAALQVSVIKPQSAYFERFGAAGLEVLEAARRIVAGEERQTAIAAE